MYDVVDSLDRAFEFVNLSVMETKLAMCFAHERIIMTDGTGEWPKEDDEE